MENRGSKSPAMKSNCKFTLKRSNTEKGRRAKKREARGSSSSSSEDDTEVVNTVREKKDDPLVQRSRLFKKYKAEVHSEDYHKDEGCSTVQTYLTSGAELVNRMKDNTVAIREVDTDFDRDQRKIEECREEVHKELEGKEDDKIYRGINNYAEYVPKKEPVQGKRLATKGPIRAPTNVRTTVRWDYEPDTCKDWRETGICGFGLSCKFAHDRGDYKFGWQLERDFEEKRKAREYGEDIEESDDDKYVIDSSDEEALPRKCPLCRKSFNSPVVTRCGHYFCEECALDQYKNSTRCYSCGKQTTGVFNPAKDLVERIEKREKLGKTYSSESEEDDTAILPDESEPKEQSPIPEDDPEYFMKMRDPYLDGHKVPKYLNKPVQTFIGKCVTPTVRKPLEESSSSKSESEGKPAGLPRVDVYKKAPRPRKEKKPKPEFVPQDDDVD